METTAPAVLYSDVVHDLVRSVMYAQLELAQAHFSKLPPSSVSDASINRHFSWLALEFPEGRNRHLFYTKPGQYSLRMDAHRHESDIPPEILSKLRTRQSLAAQGFSEGDKSRATLLSEVEDIDLNFERFVRHKPTRISALIRSSFTESYEEASEEDSEGTSKKRKKPAKQVLMLRSPLTVVYDYLTVPDSPGTRAYALVSLRNHLFETFQTVPDIGSKPPDRKSISSLRDKKSSKHFSIKDIVESYSKILTSTQPRYYSLGQDKLPPEGKHEEDGLLRHFLAMKGVLQLRFTERDACTKYLQSGVIRPTHRLRSANNSRSSEATNQFEFAKPKTLEKLPESGEIINELWGLPIPIRGADTIFRGGLKFTTNEGLVVAIHGAPGTGKTSLALAIGAYLAPLDIRTLFITAEEEEVDLKNRILGLIPEDVRRLHFFSDNLVGAIEFANISLSPTSSKGEALIQKLENELLTLANDLNAKRKSELKLSGFRIPKPCSTIVILDGLHDWFIANSNEEVSTDRKQIARLYPLIGALRRLNVLVLVTTGPDWIGNASLDYLVDVALHLTHDSISEYAAKPDRRIKLTKARHQLSASGTHGIQISGSKGLRFSPQINYQLDRRTIWKSRLPNPSETKIILKLVLPWDSYVSGKNTVRTQRKQILNSEFTHTNFGPKLFSGSHIFINGQGSGGKASLALKIALAPLLIETKDGITPSNKCKILIVSFLYPSDYYETLAKTLRELHKSEYGISTLPSDSRIKVIHLYPGHLKPNDLYNKIEWELESADLDGEPYSCVLIDGIHNVFVQFPEIEKYSLFWPQIYNSLRSRAITTITTHTILRAPSEIKEGGTNYRIDDGRSEPLRNALVQKTDFQIQVDPASMDESTGSSSSSSERLPNELMQLRNELFSVKTISSIGQPIPRGSILWSREQSILVQDPHHRNE